MGSDHAVDPGRQDIEHLAADIGVLAAGPRRHVKGVVGILDARQCCAPTERLAERFDLVGQGELVARSLLAMPRSASSAATACMNACFMPAPAPCAST